MRTTSEVLIDDGTERPRIKFTGSETPRPSAPIRRGPRRIAKRRIKKGYRTGAAHFWRGGGRYWRFREVCRQ